MHYGGKQDGHSLVVLNASVSPTVAPFTGEKFSQPVKELFPKVSRDNVVSDPDATKCFAKSELIGVVDVNDRKNSVTRQLVEQLRIDNATGIGITDIFSLQEQHIQFILIMTTVLIDFQKFRLTV